MAEKTKIVSPDEQAIAFGKALELGKGVEPKGSAPLQVARVQFPEPGYAIAQGVRKTVLEGLFDARTQVTTIDLPDGDQLLVHVSQAKTRLKRLVPKDETAG